MKWWTDFRMKQIVSLLIFSIPLAYSVIASERGLFLAVMVLWMESVIDHLLLTWKIYQNQKSIFHRKGTSGTDSAALLTEATARPIEHGIRALFDGLVFYGIIWLAMTYTLAFLKFGSPAPSVPYSQLIAPYLQESRYFALALIAAVARRITVKKESLHASLFTFDWLRSALGERIMLMFFLLMAATFWKALLGIGWIPGLLMVLVSVIIQANELQPPTTEGLAVRTSRASFVLGILFTTTIIAGVVSAAMGINK